MPTHLPSRGALLLAALLPAACSSYVDDAPSEVAQESAALEGDHPVQVSWHDNNIWTAGIAFTSFATPTGWSIDWNQPDPKGYRIRRWTNVNTSQLVTGAFAQIDLAANSWLWGMTSSGVLMKNTYPYATGGGTWQIVCTCNGRTFATGANGTVVVVTNDNPANQILRSTNDGQSWTPMTFGTSDIYGIDVDNNGDIYVIDNGLSVWRLPGGNPNGTWISLGRPPGGAGVTQVAVGNGKMFALTTVDSDNGDSVAKYTVATGWVTGALPNAKAYHIHVDAAGRLWGSDAYYRIFRYDN